MENKPITPFLKIASVLLLIAGVVSVGLCAYALVDPGILEKFNLPSPTVGTAEDMKMMTMITLIVNIVCGVVNVILAVMALKHFRIDLVAKIIGVPIVALIVFNFFDKPSVANYLIAFLPAIIPIIFEIAAYQQNKIDTQAD